MEESMDRTLVDGILRLKPAERLRLLEVIYESLHRPDQEIDEAWYDEAQRRLDAIESGKTKCVPAEKVIGKRP
jgi:putative addiction module component (TIGR02574 family)